MQSIRREEAHVIMKKILHVVTQGSQFQSFQTCEITTTTDALPLIDYTFTHPATTTATSTKWDGRRHDVVELSMAKEKGIELSGKKNDAVQMLMDKEKDLEILGNEIDKLATCVSDAALTDHINNSPDDDDETDAILQLAKQCYGRNRLVDVWDNLMKLEDCLKLHSTNAANYQQFYAEIQQRHISLTRYIKDFQEKMNKLQLKGVSAQDGGKLLNISKDTITVLRFSAARINTLANRSSFILPIHKRTEHCLEPQPATAAAHYSNKDLHFSKDDDLVLEDTSHDLYWRVRTRCDDTSLVPSLLILIPGPDYTAADSVRRLMTNLMKEWTMMMKCYGSVILEFLRRLLEYWNMNKTIYESLDPSQRDFLIEMLKHSKIIFSPLWDYSGGKVYGAFVKAVDEALRLLGNVTQKSTISVSERMVTSFGEEIVVYSRLLHFYKSLEESWTRQKSLTNATTNDGQWDITTEETDEYISRIFQQEMVEETMVQVETQAVDSMPDNVDADDYEDTVVNIEETTESALTEGITRSEQQKQEKFVISSITDPRDGEEISFDDAIEEGILDMARGLYINPETKASKVIAEAMEEGLIEVSLQTEKISEEKVSSFGLIKLTTVKESRPYVITGVVDTVTDDVLSVNVAQRQGILNKTSTEFTDTAEDVTMDIMDAIDVGLVHVEYQEVVGNPEHNKDNQETEIKTYAVHGVIDRKHKRRVSFADAVQRGILDKENGLYRDTENGVDMFVGEAIQKGLVKARKVADDSRLDIDPANTIIVEKAGKVWNKLRALSAIGALKNVKK